MLTMSAGLVVTGLYYYSDAQPNGALVGSAWQTFAAAMQNLRGNSAPTPIAEPGVGGGGAVAAPAAAQPASLAAPVSMAAPGRAAEVTPPVMTAPGSPSALTAGIAPLGSLAVTSFPTPREQQAARKQLVEGHWYGMELLDLTPQLKGAYEVPSAINGLLVDEVSLESAEAGMLAGDIVVRVGGLPVATLQDFRAASYQLRRHTSAQIDMWRKGVFVAVVLSPQQELGPAMFEAASPIPPGAVSPHKDLGQACTDCHLIMATGGQLPIDAGDLLPQPPPITNGARPPHGDRGFCPSCHRVVIASPPPQPF